MTSLLLSKFETYLLDEEQELEYTNEMVMENQQESNNYEEYPAGFFTSL
ncbi:hypothetical protein [Lysinibacillus antri]|nr:hypothetical protein [Lysinibacillus antri]